MSREDTAKLVGKLATSDAGRDAIHVAVIPVFASEDLGPGQHVGIGPDQSVHSGYAAVGVVDPFLKSRVMRGERFFLFLYPGSITSLRHVWTHAAFADEGAAAALDPSAEENPMTRDEALAALQTVFTPVKPSDKAASEAWLRAFVKVSDSPNYDTLIAAAVGKPLPANQDGASYRNDGEYLTFYGLDAHGDIPPEFWDHVEVVTGVTIPPRDRAPFFSCSC